VVHFLQMTCVKFNPRTQCNTYFALENNLGHKQHVCLSPPVANGKLHVLQDVFHLYAFALCLQIFIHIPYFIKVATFRQTTSDVVRKILDVCCYAAPIGVPTIMMMTGRIGHYRLARHKISLMFPESLKVGALADVVCFDKTGTLTHSAVYLSILLPAAKFVCMFVR